MPLIQRALAITCVGLVVGLAHSGIVRFKLGPTGPQGTAPVAPGAETGAPNAQPPAVPAGLGLEITVPQAFELFGKGVPFLDARALDEYEAGHVENGFWLTADQFMSGKVPAVLDLLDKSGPLVVYCGGGDCDASKNVVSFLEGLGFTRCHIMTDGFPAWQKAGHPVGAGKPPVGAD